MFLQSKKFPKEISSKLFFNFIYESLYIKWILYQLILYEINIFINCFIKNSKNLQGIFFNNLIIIKTTILSNIFLKILRYRLQVKNFMYSL